jgi:hypothetical protein
MPDGSLKRADRLSPNDKLLDKNKKQLKILKLASGNYHGPIHHIAATSWDEKNPTIEGHLINIAGVISADYFAELFLQPKSNLLNEQQVGTNEYHN